MGPWKRLAKLPPAHPCGARRDAARVCTADEVAETERYLADTLAAEREKATDGTRG